MSIGYFEPIDPNEMLSQKFTLADLCVTNTGLPNLPAEGSSELKNLKWTAGVLDQLYDEIGPFQILSGFRTKEVQEKLRSEGEPTSAGKSFHEAGMAVDIYPTSMSIDEYFGRIVGGPWKEKLGEIAYKPTQNSLHISMPTSTKIGLVMALNSAGQYTRLTAEEIQEYAKPYLEAISSAVSEVTTTVTEALDTPSGKFALYTMFAAAGIFLLALMTGKKRTA